MEHNQSNAISYYGIGGIYSNKFDEMDSLKRPPDRNENTPNEIKIQVRCDPA